MRKIPISKMDDVDAQQQEDIDRATSLAWGAIWVTLVVTVLNFCTFVFALVQMGDALQILNAVLVK